MIEEDIKIRIQHYMSGYFLFQEQGDLERAKLCISRIKQLRGYLVKFTTGEMTKQEYLDIEYNARITPEEEIKDKLYTDNLEDLLDKAETSNIIQDIKYLEDQLEKGR